MSLQQLADSLNLDIAQVANFVRQGMPETTTEAQMWLQKQTAISNIEDLSESGRLSKLSDLKDLALSERYLLENAARRGEVASWESVMRTWARLIEEAKAQLLTLPDRLCRMIHFPNNETREDTLKDLRAIVNGALRTLQQGESQDEYDLHNQ